MNLKDTEVNKETIAIDDIHKDFVLYMDNDLGEVCESQIDKIEHTSRDGFIPHSFNQGGYYTHILMSIHSGGFNSTIQNEINSNMSYIHDSGVEEFGESYDPCNNQEHGDWESNAMSDDNSDMFYIEARAMFNGQDESGVYTTTFELIARVSDAPYFRYADSIAEYSIEYKTAKELKEKLEKNNVFQVLLDHISKGEENLDLCA